MEIKILWTDEAIGRLKDIFDYYSKVATVNIAQKLVNEIVDSSNILITHPEIGVQEELLKEKTNIAIWFAKIIRLFIGERKTWCL
jgi:plasmid stabilization system protein ParE